MIERNNHLQHGLSRRRFMLLAGGVGAAAVATACGSGTSTTTAVGSGASAVTAAENARRSGTGRTVPVTLRARPERIDLGGVVVDTWAYDGRVPGPEIRARRGDVLSVDFANELPDESTVHWHGIALRNDMDGVPELTQAAVRPEDSFRYEFTVPDAGTHWFHPHVGMQLDRGLYAPLIVEDPDDGADYDLEAVLVLDDWLDGVAGTPDEQLATLRREGMPGMSGMDHGAMGGMGMGGMGMRAGPGNPLGTDAGDVNYPYYLINGRTVLDPVTVAGRPGQRIRLRIVNAAADTAFRFAVGGHRMTVTHSDGYRVEPLEAESVLISMGERFDVTVTLGDGAFPIVASAEGKNGHALAVLRTGAGETPGPDARPRELTANPVTGAQLRAPADVRLAARVPDRTHDLILGMEMSGYTWTVNGETYGDHTPLEVTEGERVRLRFVNGTMMFHPMHVHGHTYQVVDRSGAGARKDTSLVLPGQTVEVDLDATNPGQWMIHCHNLYHGEAGMMTVLSYVD
ncbi:multicopper oxidase domain-containing protein [Rhodococcus hoagii]|uniref:Multicopper oxidase domain-containing protein n=1 Tax=Rhodococcus hoagii TaxID=43767 RepID=A0AAE3BCT0_RHOHA|nr:multicopper oxidase domain-containing protein [Prescottella equi]MBM4538788.1 multicopper oxidase domain-containing protein [Prescottella equi]MBM4538876.1 multicopper oxidase domain-containing protein [Prescottella equi]MBM4540500.1 multicopper oxidase domain-containing protein [Prescottella equi]MBM4717147.1 multicopper oxidase domain-containing protein [Prescottella equi]